MRSAILVLFSTAGFAAPADFSELLSRVKAGSPKLAESIQASMKANEVKNGTAVMSVGGDFVFAIESAAEPTLLFDDQPADKMIRAAGSSLWAAAAKLATSRTHNFVYKVNGEIKGGKTDVPAFGPYAYEKAGVPRGKLSEKMVHESKIYPGMKSDYWVYAPAQYSAATPAAVMVWQDGEVLINRELPYRSQIVWDNLTAEKKIPVMIHVLISPGLAGQRRMRSIEYDTVDDTYPRFILQEILPEVAKAYNLRTDGYSRAIAGDSSGGICAFNAGWWRPEEFGRILSRIGSFTSIQWQPGKLDGGNVYPNMIRKQVKRNLRVWLQDGTQDIENEHGSWPLQNIQMANSLKMLGYDFHLAMGNGTHSRMGGNVEMAEELIWLWRGYDAFKTSEVFEMDPAEKGKPFFRVKIANRE